MIIFCITALTVLLTIGWNIAGIVILNKYLLLLIRLLFSKLLIYVKALILEFGALEYLHL